MKPERWQQIEILYHAARERAPNERTVYLAEACAGDSDLRNEVEALLRADNGTRGIGNVVEQARRQPDTAGLSETKTPLQITALTRLVFVMKGGKVYKNVR